MDELTYQVTLNNKEYQLIKDHRRRMIDKVVQMLTLQEIQSLMELCEELKKHENNIVKN